MASRSSSRHGHSSSIHIEIEIRLSESIPLKPVQHHESRRRRQEPPSDTPSPDDNPKAGSLPPLPPRDACREVEGRLQASPQLSRLPRESIDTSVAIEPIRSLKRQHRSQGLANDILPELEERPIDSPRYLPGARRAIVCIATALVMLLSMLDASIVSTAIPKITDEFHSLNDIGWYVSIYQLASAALQPLTGQIYTKFSTRGVYLVFFTIFLAGSAICGAANSSRILIIGRAVAGMGSGGLMNGTMIILSVIMPKQPGDAVTSLVMGVSQLGIVLGPVVGGVFTSSLTWRWCFYINLPIGSFVLFSLFLIRIPEQIQKRRALEVIVNLHRELDLVGFVLFTPALLMLLLALQFGGREFKWASPTTIGLFSGSGGLFLTWLVWNWFHGDRALIPFSMMRRSVVWTSALTQFCLMTVVFSAAYFLPIYFQAVKGVTPFMSGVYVLPGIGCQLVSVVLSGALAEQAGLLTQCAVASGILTAVSNGLFSTLTASTATAKWVGYQVLNGVGRGMGLPLPIIAVKSLPEPKAKFLGIGIVIFFGNLGPAIMLAVGNVIFNFFLQEGLSRHGYLSPATAAKVMHAGITGFRQVVNETELPFVLDSYSLGLNQAFYLVTAIGCVSALTGLLLGVEKRVDAEEEE